MANPRTKELLDELRRHLKECNVEIDPNDLPTEVLNNCKKLFDSLDSIAQKRKESIETLKSQNYTYLNLERVSGITRKTLANNATYSTIIHAYEADDKTSIATSKDKITAEINSYKEAYEQLEIQLKEAIRNNIESTELTLKLQEKDDSIKTAVEQVSKLQEEKKQIEQENFELKRKMNELQSFISRGNSQMT